MVTPRVCRVRDSQFSEDRRLDAGWVRAGGGLHCQLDSSQQGDNTTVQYSTVQYSTVQYSTVQYTTTPPLSRAVSLRYNSAEEIVLRGEHLSPESVF